MSRLFLFFLKKVPIFSSSIDYVFTYSKLNCSIYILVYVIECIKKRAVAL